MDNTKKLKIVFDFISEYLSDDKESKESKDVTETKEVILSDDKKEINDKLERAHAIMKKIDEIDSRSATTTHAVNEATKPLKKQIEETKRKYNEFQGNNFDTIPKAKSMSELRSDFKEKTGVTLNSDGKIVEVKTGPLKGYTTISDIMNSSKGLKDETSHIPNSVAPTVAETMKNQELLHQIKVSSEPSEPSNID